MAWQQPPSCNDNGSEFRAEPFARSVAAVGAKQRFIRAGRPQTNGATVAGSRALFKLFDLIRPDRENGQMKGSRAAACRAKSAGGDRPRNLVENGVNLGLDDAHSGTNLSPLPLGLRPVAGPVLEQPSLAVD
jgi:hypothetical protein